MESFLGGGVFSYFFYLTLWNWKYAMENDTWKDILKNLEEQLFKDESD